MVYIPGQDRTSPKLGLTTPLAWMDAVGVHIPSQSATQFAIPATAKSFNQNFFGLPKF